MKKYDSYKKVSSMWFSKCPSHWLETRLKFVTTIRNGFAFKSENFIDEGVPVVRIGDIKPPEVDLSNAKCVTLEEANCLNEFNIKENDILLAMTGATIGKTASFRLQERALLNQRVGLLRARSNLNQGFLHHLLNINAFEEYIQLECGGSAQENIGKTELNEFSVFLPPLDEQTQIANYLDRKTSQIDDLIAKKERLIELLEEERVATINQAVTKGLDPSVPMKDSGIEWLGEIPAHWETTKVKFITDKIGSGVTPKGGAEVYQDYGIPLLRSQNIYFDHFKLNNVAYISEEIHSRMSNSQVLRGDVLINITGGSIGRCYYVSDEFQEANVNQHVCIVRPNSKVYSRFLHLLLSSDLGQNQIFICQLGGNREALNFEQLKNFDFAIPNRVEQEEIINRIDSDFFRIDTLRQKMKKEIEYIKEYKAALISEVVTGKVDVRNENLN